MQTTIRKTTDAKARREKLPKDDALKPQDEKVKTTSVSTPRNYLQKSTTADIYGQKKKESQSTKAPRKSMNTTKLSNASPMKDLLRASQSSTSLKSNTSTLSSTREKTKMAAQKVDAKTKPSTKVKDFNVTVNSPVVKRKLNLEKEKSFVKDSSKKERSSNAIKNKKEGSFIKESAKKVSQKVGAPNTHKVSNKNDSTERQRTKTRTLNENEVKILRPEAVDNNVEMLNLSRQLTAKPKAYFIDLEEDKAIQIEQQQRPKSPSDEEVSYEDDFESYESDFDSYHSSSSSLSERNACDSKSEQSDDVDGDDQNEGTEVVEHKEVRDEEKMLDSGNFDLRDQRSASIKKSAVLDFILETSEGGEEKRSSLTDEGFQEMSSSSAVSSIRTVHTDVLDRPLFIDFTKSKENKRKRRINERLKQRAKDLLSIISLHEMSYSLFEMKPISYDLFMATFGRSNYQQVAVQTFDDGITEEVQTEEIECVHKWTQHPVDFSKSDVCFSKIDKRKYSTNVEDYLTKFTFLTTLPNVQEDNVVNLNDNYKTDPLRIYFEQRNGAGPNEMLPYETYKSKLKNNEFNFHRLSKFLKKVENKISNVLNTNSGNTELTELKMSKFSFSKGYISISSKNIKDEKFSFLNNSKISQVCFSITKNNLIMTVHKKAQNTALKKCTICLWDIGDARQEPTKILTAIDNVIIGRFRGATDGNFVAALEDGSIHLWDLSEEPTWCADVASAENTNKLVEINEKGLTALEKDRQWNLKNSHVGLDECNIHCPLQACAFTNSAHNMSNGDSNSNIVGLEFTGNGSASKEGRRLLGQVVALQRTGVLTVWSIIQEKSKTVPPDIGKAFLSKMKLEKNQTIHLVDHINTSIKDNENKISFNLNAAKRRIQNRKQEKSVVKSGRSRPKSTFDFDIDRPASAASVKNKKVLPVQKDVSKSWESGIVCYDLKVIFWKNSDSYLVAKNSGEVLHCTRTLGSVRVNTFCIGHSASSVTCLEVSAQKLPYYLAATDAGTISICSLVEDRVLLTLDCRNIPNQELERCQADQQGRYISTVATKSTASNNTGIANKLTIASLCWSQINPCCIFASLDGSTVSWDLAHSDIYVKNYSENAASMCVAGDNCLALLTPNGEVQIHKLTDEHRKTEYYKLFEKYVALL